MAEATSLDERAAKRLASARARLVLDHPFLGTLTLRLALVPVRAPWCKTLGTDTRAIFFNPDWIDRLDVAQVQFALAHEALHCALGHFARRGHRIQRRWDLACDFAINLILVDEGLKPPPDAVILDPFRGLSAEEIYPQIDDDRDDETLDEHLYDGDSGGSGQESPPPPASATATPPEAGQAQPNPDSGGRQGTEEPPSAPPRPTPLSPDERDARAQDWERFVAAAAQQADLAGRLSGTLSRLVEARLHPPLPWRSLLAQFLSRLSRSDYSYSRPSRREGEALYPRLAAPHGELAVALDLSGSIRDEEISQFLGELDALRGALSVRVTLFACDAALSPGAPWIFEPWENARPPGPLAGGGDTDFRPVFAWIAEQNLRPDALVYFTDAQGAFPDSAPEYPVLWVVKGNAPLPWGQRITLTGD